MSGITEGGGAARDQAQPGPDPGQSGPDPGQSGPDPGQSAPDQAGPEHDHVASFPYVVGRVNQGIRRALRARLAAWGLSVQEYTTLSLLAARPGLSNAQLARRALVTPQSMIEILAKLERRGLVHREADPGHALILRARLTAEGTQLLAHAEPAIRAVEDEALAGVPQSDRAAALRAMRTAMRNLARSRSTDG